MPKIKTFISKNRLDLEEIINIWFKDNPNIKIIDVEYAINSYYNVILIYEVKEKENKDEQKQY